MFEQVHANCPYRDAGDPYQNREYPSVILVWWTMLKIERNSGRGLLSQISMQTDRTNSTRGITRYVRNLFIRMHYKGCPWYLSIQKKISHLSYQLRWLRKLVTLCRGVAKEISHVVISHVTCIVHIKWLSVWRNYLLLYQSRHDTLRVSFV